MGEAVTKLSYDSHGRLVGRDRQPATKDFPLEEILAFLEWKFDSHYPHGAYVSSFMSGGKWGNLRQPTNQQDWDELCRAIYRVAPLLEHRPALPAGLTIEEQARALVGSGQGFCEEYELVQKRYLDDPMILSWLH